MQINSIKMKKEVTEITFTDTRNTQTITSVIVDATTPAPEFLNAFERLKTLANELTNGWFESDAVKNFRVNKVGFKTNEQDALGCYLHCTVEFENSNRPINLNTQVKYALADGAEESEFCLSGEAVDLLHLLQRLANDFMNGVRAQTELDLTQNVPNVPQLPAGNKTYVNMGSEAVTAPKRLRKNRKTCYDCNKASSMVIDGVGYCDEHGQARLVPE